MTPTQAIADLDTLRKQINSLVSHLGWEMEGIAEEWACLGNVGGQRDDHAAALLARLRPHLAGLARFAQTCEQQIDGFVADPFGRNAA